MNLEARDWKIRKHAQTDLINDKTENKYTYTPSPKI